MFRTNQPSISKLSLIVVCAGSDAPDLARLAGSISPSANPSSSSSSPENRVDIEVYVVENTQPPHDDDILKISSDHEAFTHLRTGGNIGFGRAVNAGFEMACQHHQKDATANHWILICNADLEFPPESLKHLLQFIRHFSEQRNLDANRPVGLIAPRLLDPAEEGGQTQPSIGRFPTFLSLVFGKLLRSRKLRKYIPTPRQTQSVEWATGACLAVRADAFASVNGFDPGFFLDYEDTDLCIRLGRAGWQCVICPDWEVVHVHPNAHAALPNPSRHVHTRCSLMRYVYKHRPRLESLSLEWLMRCTSLVRNPKHPHAPSWIASANLGRSLRKGDARSDTSSATIFKTESEQADSIASANRTTPVNDPPEVIVRTVTVPFLDANSSKPPTATVIETSKTTPMTKRVGI